MESEIQFANGNVKVDDNVPCEACLDTNTTTPRMIHGESGKEYAGYQSANYCGHTGAF